MAMTNLPARISAGLARLHLSFIDVILIIFPCALLLQIPMDPDLGWHLRVGQDIWRGIFPFEDIYTWSMPGHAWVDHEWLTNAVMYQAYRIGGLIGQSLPFFIICLAAYIVAARTGALIGRHLPGTAPLTNKAGWQLSLGLVTVGLLVNAGIIGGRAQMITLFGFALVNYLLWQYLLGERRNLWVMVGVFWLWANTHAGFIIGLATVGLALGLLLVARFIPALQSQGDSEKSTFPFGLIRRDDYRRMFRHVLLVLVVSVLATLINPYTWRLYEEAIRTSLDSYARANIVEWLPVSMQNPIGILIFAFTFLFVWWLLWRRKYFSAWHLLLMPVFFYLGMSSNRHTALLVLFMLPWVYLAASAEPEVRQFLEKKVDRFFGLHKGNRLYYTYNIALALVPLVLLAFRGALWVNTSTDPGQLAERAGFPTKAVQFLAARDNRANRENEKLLNDYNWGGYLIWNLPDYKVYIDGRMASWRGEKYIYKEYNQITALEPSWLDLLDANKVTLVLMPRESNLSNVLRYIPAYTIVYEDDVATIFEHKPLN